jgi:hypothetical protein
MRKTPLTQARTSIKVAAVVFTAAVLAFAGPSAAEPTGPQVMAVSAPVATATVTVAAGQSLSPALDLGTSVLVGIQTPSAMDSATTLTYVSRTTTTP